jgi:hypothetical protein
MAAPARCSRATLNAGATEAAFGQRRARRLDITSPTNPKTARAVVEGSGTLVVAAVTFTSTAGAMLDAKYAHSPPVSDAERYPDPVSPTLFTCQRPKATERSAAVMTTQYLEPADKSGFVRESSVRITGSSGKTRGLNVSKATPGSPELSAAR